jgi:hypothetical protein
MSRPTTVDAAARESAAALRLAIAEQVHVTGSLDDLKHRTGQRGRRGLVPLVVATGVVLALVIGLLRGAVLTRPAPVDHKGEPTPLRWEMCLSTTPNPCADLAPGDYRVPLAVPFTATLAGPFTYYGDGANQAEFYMPIGHVAVIIDPSSYPDRVLFTDAHVLADWIASRPYLSTGPLTRTTISGAPAWQIDVRLTHPDLTRLVRCDGPTGCASMLFPGDAENFSGPWSPIAPERWYLVQLPSHRVAVIAIDGTEAGWNAAAVLAEDDPVARSIIFSPSD